MERGQPVKKRIPVILDTDIGNDIDDTRALVFALLRDELDIRLVTTVLGDPIYSAKLIAKLVQVCGKAPIDIGLGKSGPEPARYQGAWVADYDLSSYGGKIYGDGVARMLEVIHECTETVTILGMGPCTNLAEALRRDPRIAEKVRVISIFGGLFRGYFGPEPCAEYNVHQDMEAAKAVLAGYPHLLISPIDTFFDMVLDGERLERIRRCRDTSAPRFAQSSRTLTSGLTATRFGGTSPATAPPNFATCSPSTLQSPTRGLSTEPTVWRSPKRV